MSVDRISSSNSSLVNDNKPTQSLENSRQTLKDVAQNDFGSAGRLANDSSQSLRDISKTLTDAANLIDSASNFMKDMQSANPQDLGKLFSDAGKMLNDAANLMDDLNKLSTNSNLSEALKDFTEGKQNLLEAARTLTTANGATLGPAATRVAEHSKAAGKAVQRGLVAAEREAGTRKKATGEAAIASSMMRDQILKQMANRNNNMPKISRADSPARPAETDRPEVLTKGEANTTAKPSLKERVNNYIDKTVDNVLYNKLKLKPKYEGQGNKAGERTKTFGKGITAEDVKNYALTGATPYGTEGKTLLEGTFNKNFGEINKSVSGRFGTASVSGVTSVGARGRVFGDVSLKDRQAYIGAEGEVGAHATYNATYNSPHAHIAGQDIGVDAGVTADVFAGAAARGKIGVSLKGNSPEVQVGGEVFAGARAQIQGGAAANINGKQVAEVHGTAQGWAGVGAKANVDVGFKDGKLKVDLGIGAALGIGGSVDWGFTVDVAAIGNGIKNGVKNFVGNAVSGIEDLGKTLGSTASNAAKAIGNSVSSAVKDVGSTISNAAKTVGATVTNAAKDVGHTISNAAKEVTHTVSNAIHDAGKSVKSFFKSIF